MTDGTKTFEGTLATVSGFGKTTDGEPLKSFGDLV